jgi:Flp pilus assembly protein TadG
MKDRAAASTHGRRREGRMNTPPTCRADRRSQSGMALVLIAIFAVLLIGFVALVVDGGHAWEMRARCQATADAAALAAAQKLPDQAAARTAALAIAGQNMNSADHGTVLASSDVEFGSWDFTTSVFTVTNVASSINAVRVTARRAIANSNPMPLSFAQLFGYSTLDLKSTVIAAAPTAKTWDLMLLQDVTSSFSSELTQARTADHQLLDCFNAMAPAASLFGVETFTGWSNLVTPLSPIGTSYALLNTGVSNIKVCGSSGAPVCSGTDISAGLQLATNLLAAVVAPSGTSKAIVLVSDGQPEPSSKGSHPTATVAQLKTFATQWADNANAAGISIFVVFYNATNDAPSATFMQSLVRGQGIYLSTPDPTQIPVLLNVICGKLGKPQLVY